MNSNKVITLMMGVLLAAMLLVGFGTATAQAQQSASHRPGPVEIYSPYQVETPDWGRAYWGSKAAGEHPTAQHRAPGYREGYKRGRDDARHAKAYAPDNHKHYSESGRTAYRQAFLEGYADGYDQQMER